MKVLFITREYPPFAVGGVAVHTFNLVKYLTKLGVSCKVLSFGSTELSSDNTIFVNPSSSIIDRNDSSIALDARIPFDIIRFSRIANTLIKKEKFDIIHVEEPYVGPFIHNGKQVKVSTFHDTSFGEIYSIFSSSIDTSSLKRTIFYALFGFCFELMSIVSSKALIVPTPQVRDELSKIYGVPRGKIEIVENGVEIPALDKVADRYKAKVELGFDSNTALIFTIARMVSRKRLDLLVKAIRLLHNKGLNNFHVCIAGDGPDRQNIARLVKQYDLNNIIELPHWVSDEQKRLYYQAADIFVLPSQYEGFPLTLLEAMSYGVAAITSKMESLSNLRNGVDGLLFPTGDYHALSECIKTLLNNSSLRAELSDSGRKFATRYDWQTVAEQTKKLYESL